MEVPLPFFQQGICHDTLLYSPRSKTKGGFLSSTNLSTNPLPTKWSIKWTDSFESAIHIIVANLVSIIMKSTWLNSIYTRHYERKRKTNLRKHCCQGFSNLDAYKTFQRINTNLKYSLGVHKGIHQGRSWSFLTWRRKKRSKKECLLINQQVALLWVCNFHTDGWLFHYERDIVLHIFAHPQWEGLRHAEGPQIRRDLGRSQPDLVRAWMQLGMWQM